MLQARTHMCSLTREESDTAWLWQFHNLLQGLHVQEGLRFFLLQFYVYKKHIIAPAALQPPIQLYFRYWTIKVCSVCAVSVPEPESQLQSFLIGTHEWEPASWSL